MSTDDLIAGLTMDLRAVGARAPRRELALLALVGGIELLLCLAAGLVRPDFYLAMAEPVLWWKLLSLALLAAIGTVTAIAALAPDRSPRRGLQWLGAALFVVLATGAYLMLAHPIVESLADRVDWHHGVQCVAKMVLLALPAVAILAWLARCGAPTDCAATALAVGVGGGAWGAFVFAFVCPSDDPLYIMLWYLIGCGGVALATRLVVPRIARW